MSRKAQALPLNTVVLAILVVLVLLVIGAFFLGGTSGISKQIRSIFYGTTAGTDRVIATGVCQERCQQLNIFTTRTAIATSAYCTQSFPIDTDNDGEADFIDPNEPKKGYKQYYCYQKTGKQDAGSLGVRCQLNQFNDGTLAETLCPQT